ncbi:MAG: hypothetical protein IIW48_07830 [Clostridia bacterium]|nr:hypothetical protein [Clostridia bacterium]
MQTVSKNISGSIAADIAAADELELINKYTIRPFTEEEVFCFTLTLCDNEIDRDFERFTVDALIKLSTMFEGKTGITDHNMKADNQTARIFRTWIEESEDETTSTGEKYTCLKARAYMPLTPKNEELVAQIEAGIKKETSISCSVSSTTCSVCGADARRKGCKHRTGEIYNGKLCHTVLDSPEDAYEWSFVAVPAQPRAGVTKAFEAQDNMTLSQLKEKSCGYDVITLSTAAFGKLTDEIARLEALAKDAQLYRNELEQRVIRLAAMTMPSLAENEFADICKALTATQLATLEKSFSHSASKLYPIKPQLGTDSTQAADNNEFKI